MTTIYQELNSICKRLVAESPFISASDKITTFGGFGNIKFPFIKMGAVSTLDLFGLDELIIFSFYWTNRNRYRKAADIGANLGLHSILMEKCGWQVTAYEPDPKHLKFLRKNLKINRSVNVEVVEAAVSDQAGLHEFVRVLGNTTSSHLAGAKRNAYGELEKFTVHVENITTIMPKVDFIKMDAEGQEKTIILATDRSHWEKTDMMVEIGSPENAEAIYNHIKSIGVHAFSQKLGWEEVLNIEGMPTSYKEGSLFITKKHKMFWG